MPAELGYFTLTVKDVMRAKTFYGALFGWEIEATAKGGHVGNTKLAIGLAAGAPAHVPFAYFKVADLDQTTKRLSELGGKVRARSDSPSGLMAECEDDQGTVFSIWQPAPGFD